MATAFIAREIFDGHALDTGSAVLVHEGKVVGIVPVPDIPAGYRQQAVDGYMLAPAFMDLQIYGGNGKLFSTELSTDALEATYEYCLQGGCTQFLITMATNSTEKYLQGMEAIRSYQTGGGKGLLGLHLEGPYISAAKRGAHLAKYVRKPSSDEIRLLLSKGKGVLRMMTLAPEECDKETIDLLLANKVILSAGHSLATYQQAIDGFYGGIQAATHLFNAMSPLQGRELGMVGAIYDHADVRSSIVCDGVHVDFASVRISKKILGERLFFITDAVAEVPYGEYPHVFHGDRYTLPDGTLSGSALTMLLAVRNGVEKAGIPLPEALRMASLYPATVMGLEKKWGSIQAGARADFVLLDEQLNLLRVIVDGEE
ncbi:MAG: N-acetylglucosamine-6-phosphate deacetylase [Bacteroidota bacterium]|nr:N-acetylglucosamine-6-phosphate deacetylase [Bacteroidota bacterium]MDP4244346.1 N-acetylglucosamine-6-phosphate deacetylase [Bacteroidota bacterium]